MPQRTNLFAPGPAAMLALSGVAVGAALMWFLPAGALADPPATAANEAADAAGAGTAVLDTYSFWRRFVTFRPIVVAGKPPRGMEELAQLARRPQDQRSVGSLFALFSPEHLGFPYECWTHIWTALPPADWMAREFDDSGWRNAPGPWYPGYGDDSFGPYCTVPQWSRNAALLCMRGRFELADPARIKQLRLSIQYRGGLVVYLNGQEAARDHLPDGPLEMETLADPYPDETFAAPEGNRLPQVRADFLFGVSRYRSEETKAGLEKYKDRFTRRLRRVEATVPTSLLRKGTNILALELHRSAVSPVVEDKRLDYRQVPLTWLTVGLNKVELRAQAEEGAGLRSGLVAGMQVWNAPTRLGVFDVDYGEIGRPLGPVRIVSTLNGAFWGQVVVSSDRPIRGLNAQMTGPLKRRHGRGAIAASAIEIRYPQANTTELNLWAIYPIAGVRRFDALRPAPPSEVPVAGKKTGAWAGDWVEGAPRWDFAAAQPVWVRVNIPADAAVGDYEGQLLITADGQAPVAVPVQVRVCAWKMPNPEDFDTVMDFLQSPDWNVWHYKVPRWSDRHWQLMEETFKILYTIGNRTVYVPLICRTHLEHEEGMVRWVKRADGTCEHDFGPMEKYLDLALKCMPSLRMVCLIVFDRYVRSNRGPPAAPWVSLLDPATAKVEPMQAPPYSDPQARDFWRPVAEGVRKRLADRGLDLGRNAMLGLVNDYGVPDKQTVALWKDLLAETGWQGMGHGGNYSREHGGRQAYGVSHAGLTGLDKDVFSYRRTIYPYGSRYGWDRERPWDPARKRCAADPPADAAQTPDSPRFMLLSGRDFLKISESYRNHRLAAEFVVQGTRTGIGFQPADWWYELWTTGRDAERMNDYGSDFPSRFCGWGNNGPTGRKLDPGPDGPLTTIRFEMLREGVQETEARILIEKALVDQALRGRLGDELTGKCEEFISQRTRLILRSVYSYEWYAVQDWQAHSEELFSLAAEVAEAIGRD